MNGLTAYVGGEKSSFDAMILTGALSEKPSRSTVKGLGDLSVLMHDGSCSVSVRLPE